MCVTAATAEPRSKPRLPLTLLVSLLSAALAVAVEGVFIGVFKRVESALQLTLGGVWLSIPLILEAKVAFGSLGEVSRESTGRTENLLGFVGTGLLLGALHAVVGGAALAGFVVGWTYIVLVTLSGRALRGAPRWAPPWAPAGWLAVAWTLFFLL